MRSGRVPKHRSRPVRRGIGLGEMGVDQFLHGHVIEAGVSCNACLMAWFSADAASGHRETNAITFEKAARAYYADQKDGWKNEKHAAQWIKTLETYVFAVIGGKKSKSLKQGNSPTYSVSSG